MSVPAQQGPSPEADRSAPRPGGPDTETTRQLCVGAYLRAAFRRGVIEELVRHEERGVAPSTGVDVLPVLAHALRARSLEVRAGLATAALWALFYLADRHWGNLLWSGEWSLAEAYESWTERRFFLPADLTGQVVRWPGSGFWALNYALVCLVMWAVRGATGRGTTAYSLDGLRGAAPSSNWLIRGAAYALWAAYWGAALTAFWNDTRNWMALVFPVLLALPVRWLRREVESVIGGELTRENFGREPRTALPDTPRLRRIGAAVAREQHSRLVLYDPARPFVGLGGTWQRPWSLVMDLRRKPAAPVAEGALAKPDPLTARFVLERVRDRLSDLGRLPGATGSRDRMLALEIDELVYLPSGPPRDGAVHDRAAVGRHLRESVGEGGEARRHFLRVRVNAWEHHVVVSVLIRVHTQGELLVLEVMPHVLTPLAEEFRLGEAVAERRGDTPAVDAAWALLSSPAAGPAAVFCLVRSAWADLRTWLARPQEADPEPAARSVRELAGTRALLPFQRMDVSRYVKTVHERIATGAVEALKAKGHDTGELEQQIVHVSNGGVYIGAMSGGAVAGGKGAMAWAGERLRAAIGD